VARSSVEETPNARLDAEVDTICQAHCHVPNRRHRHERAKKIHCTTIDVGAVWNAPRPQ